MVLEVAGLTVMPTPLVASMAVRSTLKVRVPAPATPVQVNVKVWLAPVAMAADGGVGSPQLTEAVPVVLMVIPGITLLALVPLLATVAVTVMVSPGPTVAPRGPLAATAVIARPTALTAID